MIRTNDERVGASRHYTTAGCRCCGQASVTCANPAVANAGACRDELPRVTLGSQRHLQNTRCPGPGDLALAVGTHHHEVVETLASATDDKLPNAARGIGA